ncbi:MAG: hypothetical protein AAFR93_09765 [Pseudomonadota bacterium]
MFRILVLCLALLGLSACYSVQTTSGAEYVARTGPSGTTNIDAEIARAASVEPNLIFPARIGVARIVNGQLTTAPGAESALWADLARENRDLGEFIFVSPVVAEMMQLQSQGPRDLVRTIRKAAARQHLDHVLIYEVGARSRRGNTALALADVTLIGAAVLPTRQLKVAGTGQALLVDVRNGYPYGTAQTTVDLSSLSVSFGAAERQRVLQDKAVYQVVEQLTGEVGQMLAELRRRLGQ